MAIKLYHHPWSRAANTVWMLEELGVDYTLEYVDIKAGAHKDPAFLALNPMGKLPTLETDGVVLTESAAIALYLADRHSLGRLAPALDDPARATYYRWILYGPSVIEPACYAHNAKWEYGPGAAGWGTYEAMLATCDHAIGEGPWLLGDRFTMADVCFGGTVGYMLQFGLIEKRERFVAYADRLEQREARQRSKAINERIAKEHGLGG
ncbi:MAG: glutathione S-transferase family protein [Myxococcota bacterium]